MLPAGEIADRLSHAVEHQRRGRSNPESRTPRKVGASVQARLTARFDVDWWGRGFVSIGYVTHGHGIAALIAFASAVN